MAALEGEVLAPERGSNAAVLVNASPFQRGSAKVVILPEGASIHDAVMMSGIGPNLRKHVDVFLAEHLILPRHWKRIRPKPGAQLYLRVRLRGGGDSGGKDVLRTVLMIAIVVVAAVFNPFAAGTIASSVFMVGATIAGQMLVNALIPPPDPGRDPWRFDQQPGNPYASLTGIRNQFAPYAPIPRVMGEKRMYPLLAARPYTVLQGKTQWLHLALLVGYGPVNVSDIRIGQTPISAFQGAQWEVREGWENDAPLTLFTTSVREERLTSLLEPSVWVMKVTEPGTEEVSLDITFPAGLGTTDPDDGKRKKTSVSFEVQWSVNGASWTNADWIDGRGEWGTGEDGKIVATDTSITATTRSGRFKVTGSPTKTYFVRVRRTTVAKPSYVSDTAYWSTLRSVRAGNPVNMPGLCLIGLRLKATGQLNGVPDIINCLASAYHEVYKPSTKTWSWKLTRNPAWETADVLRRKGLERLCADERLDLDAFVEWANACDKKAPNAQEKRWTCDTVLEGGSVMTAAQVLAASGRAALTIGTGGKYTVVRDVEQTTPVAHIGPRNSWGYKGVKRFADIPHAFRVTFCNPEANDAQDEVIVYRDAYNKDGSGGKIAATKFETLDLPTCRSKTQAVREGRYHLAVLELRPEEHRFNQDIESLVATKGALVCFTYDTVSIGLGSGRIAELVLDGNDDIAAIVLDVYMEMPNDAVSYGCRIRHSDQSSSVHELVYDAGPNDTLTFETPIPAEDAPEIGDLVLFGEYARESAPMLVKHIRRLDNLNAQITLVDAQPGVWSADTGPIPPFQSYINRQTPIEDTERPERPILNVRSDGAVMLRRADGTLIERVQLYLDPYVSQTVAGATWEAEWKHADANGEDWTPAGSAPIDAALYISDVPAGEIVHVRARVLSKQSIPSLWEYVFDHEVIGKTAPPGPVSSLSIFPTLRGIKIDFARSPDVDVTHYHVKYGGTSWEDATDLDATCIGPASLYDFQLTGTPVTIRVKAVDAIGLYSSEVTALTPAENARIDGAFFVGNPNLTGATGYRTPLNVLSWADAGSTATIFIASHTVSTSQSNGAARSASYNSGSVTGLDFDTTYHIWVYDPTFAGGTVTYVASTSASTYITDSRYMWVGAFTTGSDGGAGGGSGPPICIHAEAHLTATLQAKDARPGHLIDVIEDERVIGAPIEAVRRHRVQGVRLVAEGAALDCSVETPIEQPDGSVIFAGTAEGARILVHDDKGLRWSSVEAVHALGEIEVVTIQVGNRTFLAGNDPARRLGTHNKLAEEPPF